MVPVRVDQTKEIEHCPLSVLFSSPKPRCICDTYKLTNLPYLSSSCPPCIPLPLKRLFSVEHPLPHPCRHRTPLASGWLTLLLLAMITTNAIVTVVIAVTDTALLIPIARSHLPLFFSSFPFFLRSLLLPLSPFTLHALSTHLLFSYLSSLSPLSSLCLCPLSLFVSLCVYLGYSGKTLLGLTVFPH